MILVSAIWLAGCTSPGAVSPRPEDGKKPVADAPAPAVRTGDLKLDSQPSQAEVYLDGVFKGTAPIILEGLPYGTYHMDIRKEGFSPWEGEITVDQPRNSKMVALSRPPLPPGKYITGAFRSVTWDPMDGTFYLIGGTTLYRLRAGGEGKAEQVADYAGTLDFRSRARIPKPSDAPSLWVHQEGHQQVYRLEEGRSELVASLPWDSRTWTMREGKVAYQAGEPGRVYVQRPKDQSPTLIYQVERDGELGGAMEWSPDGRYLAFSDFDHLWLYDDRENKLDSLPVEDTRLGVYGWTSSGILLIASGEDGGAMSGWGDIYAYDPGEDRLWKVAGVQGRHSRLAAVSTDNRTIYYTVSDDNEGGPITSFWRVEIDGTSPEKLSDMNRGYDMLAEGLFLVTEFNRETGARTRFLSDSTAGIEKKLDLPIYEVLGYNAPGRVLYYLERIEDQQGTEWVIHRYSLEREADIQLFRDYSYHKE